MKAVFLSIVVVCALVVAGIGGTLAGFSDTERSLGNYFEVGNMDLKVSVNEIEYDDPVPAIVGADEQWPCQSQDFGFDLHNLSDNDGALEVGYAYMRLKDFDCYEVFTAKFPDFRPEPENVAERGGWLANTWIAGMGPWGQNCTLADFIEFKIDYEGAIIIGNNTPWGGAGTVYLSDMIPAGWQPGDNPDTIKWIYLGEIPGCETKYGNISLHLSNWSEEMWDTRASEAMTMPIMPGSGNLFANDLPFNDWLTNLFMNDGVEFTIEFALTADPIPAQYLIN
ncbi:hypothetical protein ES707_14789 [subsurface metagenome]